MFRMLRIFVCAGVLFAGLIYHPSVLHAQEAARVNGAQAVRFEQSPGFYHYVVFCKTPKAAMAQMPPAKLPPDSMEYALCWYATRSNGSQEVEGRIVVSEHHIRFVPGNPASADGYADMPREQVELKHEPGQPKATLQAKGSGFAVSFRFSKLCLTCAEGTPVPPGVASAAVLDQEYALLDETVEHYYSGWRQILRLSSGAPADSPTRGHSPNSEASNRPRTGAASRPEVVSKAPAPASAVPGVLTSNAANKPAPPNPVKASAAVEIGRPKKPVKIASADGLLVKKVPPDYPLEAKLVRLEGTVVLHALIDKSGAVAEVNALSGPPLLESAAVDAVKQWQYRPYALNGQPVDVETTIAVVFALDGSHPANRARALASRQNP